MVEGSYGIPILRYTETYQAVAVAATTPEVVRGLGYWFFYGNDKLGQWIVPSIDYMRYGIPAVVRACRSWPSRRRADPLPAPRSSS